MTKNRTLFFGDNLEVLNEKFPEMDEGFFDLIYLDPPFNSNRNYNVLFKEGKVDSSAQIHAFEDTWEWTDTTIRIFETLKQSRNPQIAILIESLHQILGDTPMMAYLVNMTARLVPLRQALKATGSIYLHCDPTSSHYLKIIMDVIFGKQNFRNEIIWHYRRWTGAARSFLKMHDVILFYSRTENYTFNRQFTSYTEASLKRKQNYHTRIKGEEVYVTSINKQGVGENDVWQIQLLNSQSKERLGYPTQKPESLLEKIIKTSTHEGDWVLDPFCGCGTTVAVAEKLKRNWVGIDISMQAVNIIAQRMRAHYPKIDIHIDGIPRDFTAAQAMAERDKFSFQDWGISLVNASPPSGEVRRGADRGIDGIILFKELVDNNSTQLKKIIVQVKGGHHSRVDIATLKGDIDRENSPMGIFICLNNPTDEMVREASLAGEYKYSDQVSFPKIQILSIKDWFEGKKILLPSTRINPFGIAEYKYYDSQYNLFGDTV